MGSGASTSRRTKSAPARVPDWPRQVENWQTLLFECRCKPTRKRIHLLRVATLRLQAQLRCWLDEQVSGDPSSHIAQRWAKEARYLRRALGSVRAFDVHLAKLSQLRGLLTADSGYQPRTSRVALRQLDELEARFKRDRKDSTKILKDTLAARHAQLEHAAIKLADLTEVGVALLQSLTTARLTAMLTDAVSVFSSLSPESLHDFRKRLKSVRYLSELATTGPGTLAIAAAVKSMQVVIGEWHDWEELSIYARRVFRRKDAPELTAELESLVEHSLEKALAVCTQITGEILSGSSAIQRAPKRTVHRETASNAGRHLAVA